MRSRNWEVVAPVGGGWRGPMPRNLRRSPPGFVPKLLRTIEFGEYGKRVCASRSDGDANRGPGAQEDGLGGQNQISLRA